MVTFVLLTFTQTTKLLACNGIPATKDLVIFYLASFVLPEYLRLLAGPAPSIRLVHPFRQLQGTFTLEHYKGKRIQQFGVKVAICGQVLIWNWIVAIYLDQVGSEDLKTIWEMIVTSLILGGIQFTVLIIVAIIFCTIICIIVCIMLYALWAIDPISQLGRRYSFIQRLVDNAKFELFMFCLKLFSAWACYGILLWSLNFYTPPIVSFPAVESLVHWTVFGLMLMSMMLLSIIMYGMRLTYYALLKYQRSARPLRRVLGLRGPPSKGEFYQFFGLLLNFTSIFMYYSTVYRSEKTFKPGWTEKLG